MINQYNSNYYELLGPKVLKLKNERLKHNAKKLIVKTIHTAISPGTEVAAYSGLEPLREGAMYPRVLGYCNLSEILDSGNHNEEYKKGDFILTHGSHKSIFEVSPEDILSKVSPNQNLKYATTAYLFHLGYHALITGSAKAGHNIGIIGLGVLGYTTALMSQVMGAQNTFVFSNQYSIDQKHNNLSVFRKNNDDIEKINMATQGLGVDIVVNTSNSWDDWLLAMKLVNKGGTIVNLGFPGRGAGLPTFNPFDAKYIYTKNVTIKALSSLVTKDVDYYESRFNLKQNIKFILDLIAYKKLDPSLIISEEIHYLQLEMQYKKYLNREVSFSTILNWND